MKKLFALVLAVLMVAALAACGSKTPQNENDTTNGPGSTTSSSSQSGETNPDQNETTETSGSHSGEITVESLMNKEENAAEDF